MKRKSNGLIVGTVLVILVGALIFLQARNQEAEEDPMAGPMPTAPGPGAAGQGPRVDEHLDAPTGGRMPAPAPTQ